MKFRTTLLAAASAALLLAPGCASDLSGSTYSRDGARAQQAVYHGTLTRIEQVRIEGTDGTLGGIAGALAGAAIEKSATGTSNGLELTVKLDDGSERIVVQTAGKDAFSVGQRVRLIVSGSESRVRPE